MVFFFFYVLNVFSHSLLAYKIFYEKSTDSLIGVSLYMTSHFALASFKILSLSLTYENLIIVCFVDGLFFFFFFFFSSENSLILYSVTRLITGETGALTDRLCRSAARAAHLVDAPPGRPQRDTRGSTGTTLPLGPREKRRHLGGFGMLSLLLPGEMVSLS